MRNLQFLIRMVLVVSMLTGGVCAYGQALKVPVPRTGEYFRDAAKLLSASEGDELNQIAMRLRNERQCNLFVLTIPSIKSMGGGGMRMEAFTHAMVQDWQEYQQANPEKIVDSRTWFKDYILLVISVDDRRAWVEYSIKYAPLRNQFYQVLDDHLVPYIENGKSGEGIVHSAKVIEALVSQKAAPSVPVFWGDYLVYVLMGVGTILVIGSVINSGSNSPVWRGVRVILALPNHVVVLLSRGRGSQREEEDEVQLYTGSYGGKAEGGEADEEELAEEDDETDEEEEKL